MANWGYIYCSSEWGDESNKNSIPTSQFNQCSSDCFDGASYLFTSKAALQTAVDLWVSDEAAAICTYGQINTWNTSQITNMFALFRDKTTFNSNKNPFFN